MKRSASSMANCNMATPVVVLNENDYYYFNSIPLHFLFVPSPDEDFVLCYIRKKLLNEEMPIINRISSHLNIYLYHPRDLTARHDRRWGRRDEKEWYFFTPITQLHANSSPIRAAENGFWKAFGMNIPVKDRNNEVIGYRTSLQFHELGKYSNLNKSTEWIMYEYKFSEAILPPSMTLENCVLCKIYKSERINKYQNQMPYQLEHPIDRNAAAGSTSIVGPSNSTVTTGDQLPVQSATMEHEPYSNLKVQQDGSSGSKQEEEEDGGWLIVGVEHLSISSDPMIE